eukprot:CAMPEP_0172317514 /NCGR_PEP_ID=MMETSP1058-20130122/31866_1 /TAXON_ID=83371 /ORGANISM="Detonula confervacea, Strain CCMP 353" /LENGTH=428 /DNA_ID=CAMNT_0013032093 /DNA_START=16 /DNA_END=1302 /DNA_ORIENTATION=+
MSNSSRKINQSSRVAASSAAAKTTPTKRSKSPTNASHTSDHATEPSRKNPRTPPKQSASSRSTASIDAKIVTPATSSALALEKKGAKKSPAAKSNARRSLSMIGEDDSTAAATKSGGEKSDGKKESAGAAKKKLPFGGKTKPIEIPDVVQRVYHIVHKHTGSIGGNGHGGAIYGELTTGSMQKMTNFMVKHTGLSEDSRFIDVGCGLGKPNLHVAQCPGVDFSYGIEMEHVRWMLGMSNLYQVLEAAKKDEVDGKEFKEGESKIGHGCYFAHGDITEANYFDPFTHVYMFDIGFPPRLFHQLAEMFNRSQSEYLICYHGPRLMIEDYGFNVELIVQTPTSMHGSAEGHTGYIYRRSEDAKPSKACKTKKFGVPCDPLFAKAWEMCRADLDVGRKHVGEEVEKHMGRTTKRVTRSASRKSSLAEEKKSE